MTPEELLKLWRDDPVDHALIWAGDWEPLSRGVRRTCEACGREVSVWPLVAATAARNPRFHVVCRSKCMAVALKVCGPLPFGGPIKDNVLPETLKDFA